ncbi:MAG: sugar phosphate isomerase/epimerase family protein [Candidatus Bathyarchaeia archaeon]
MRQKFEAASKVKGAHGIEVVYPAEFSDAQLNEFKSLQKQYGLKVSGLLVDLFKDGWINGSLSARDPHQRKTAVEISKRAMDVAKEVGCSTVVLWLGQDGYDYPFQAEYTQAWNNLADGIGAIADHRSDIKLAIEYKIKEARTHIFVGTVGKALMLAEETNRNNVGVTLDFGHALYAYENPAESAVLLDRKKKLFHVHLNDNYRDWDHDLVAGSVNLWDTLEFMYWLRKLNYDGWISLDIYPYREDTVSACERSIENLELMNHMIDQLGMDTLDHCTKQGDPIETTAILRKIFK